MQARWRLAVPQWRPHQSRDLRKYGIAGRGKWCTHWAQFSAMKTGSPCRVLLLAVFFLPKVFCVPGRKFVDLDASWTLRTFFSKCNFDASSPFRAIEIKIESRPFITGEKWMHRWNVCMKPCTTASPLVRDVVQFSWSTGTRKKWTTVANLGFVCTPLGRLCKMKKGGTGSLQKIFSFGFTSSKNGSETSTTQWLPDRDTDRDGSKFSTELVVVEESWVNQRILLSGAVPREGDEQTRKTCDPLSLSSDESESADEDADASAGTGEEPKPKGSRTQARTQRKIQSSWQSDPLFKHWLVFFWWRNAM